jgi:histidinol-phosphate phosphatase family protein
MSSPVLVIRFGSLGDLILASAPVLNLQLDDPDRKIVLLTKERFRPVAQMMTGLHDVVTVPDRCSTRELYRTLLDLDTRNFGTVIDLHGNPRSWFARALLSAGRSSVYPKRRLERWRLTRRHKRLPLEYPHTIELYNDALRQLGYPIPSGRPVLKPPELTDEFASATAFDGETVLIAPGAAHPNKAWPVERFAETAVALRKERGCRLIWAVAADGRDRQTAALSILPEDTVHLTDCPIDQLAAVIKASDLVIANDSGVGHLASAVGTPLVSIFGPTHPALGFAPRGLHDKVIDIDEYCRPCSRHGRTPCYRDNRYCFTGIESARVVAASRETLDLYRHLTPALFVDRDGTLIKNKHYLSDPDKVELIPGGPEAIRTARRAGYKVVVLSNQSGVARGFHTEEDVRRVNERLDELLAAGGAQLDGNYYCPHHASKGTVEGYATPCNCRKPSPGMAERAALELGLDLRRSLVVGDSLADAGLARVIGATPILVRTGYGAGIEERFQQSLVRAGVTIADDLHQAVSRHATGPVV